MNVRFSAAVTVVRSYKQAIRWIYELLGGLTNEFS